MKQPLALILSVLVLSACAPIKTTSSQKDDPQSSVPYGFMIEDGSSPSSVSSPINAQIGTPLDVEEIRVCEFPSTADIKPCEESKAIQPSRKTSERQIFSVTIKSPKHGMIISVKGSGKDISNAVQVNIKLSDLKQNSSNGGKTTVDTGEFKQMGPLSDIEDQFSDGTRTSNFKIYAGEKHNAKSPKGLLIYLHGDGAGDYTNYWPGLKTIGQTFNLIPISVLAPEGGRRWYADPSAQANFLHALIQNRIYKSYNIDKSKVYFTGMSGGSQFLTGVFLPAHGNSYLGGAIPMCGGGGPSGFSQYVYGLSPSDEFKQGFKMFYYTGTADFLFNQAWESSNFYRAKGIQVQTEWVQNVEHCAFSYKTALDKLLPQVIK